MQELRSAGAELTFVEYEHGDTADKKELSLLLEKATEGDPIITTEVSRLSRSTKQLCEIIDTIQCRQPPGTFPPFSSGTTPHTRA